MPPVYHPNRIREVFARIRGATAVASKVHVDFE